jgi:putative sterol carrier protein
VARFLSDAWLAQLEAAARLAHPPTDVTLVVQEVVLQDRGDETAYAIRIGGGTVEVVRGRVADADVTFTQDRATAAAIASGELSAQSAFMAGRLRMGGDLRAVLDRSQDLAALDDVFASARATTDW